LRTLLAGISFGTMLRIVCHYTVACSQKQIFYEVQHYCCTCITDPWCNFEVSSLLLWPVVFSCPLHVLSSSENGLDWRNERDHASDFFLVASENYVHLLGTNFVLYLGPVRASRLSNTWKEMEKQQNSFGKYLIPLLIVFSVFWSNRIILYFEKQLVNFLVLSWW
jgi:hypothetical protein